MDAPGFDPAIYLSRADARHSHRLFGRDHIDEAATLRAPGCHASTRPSYYQDLIGLYGNMGPLFLPCHPGPFRGVAFRSIFSKSKQCSSSFSAAVAAIAPVTGLSYNRSAAKPRRRSYLESGEEVFKEPFKYLSKCSKPYG
jgi:hypothetical protein